MLRALRFLLAFILAAPAQAAGLGRPLPGSKGRNLNGKALGLRAVQKIPALGRALGSHLLKPAEIIPGKQDPAPLVPFRPEQIGRDQPQGVSRQIERALERLASEPYQPPKDQDLAGQKRFASDSFDHKLGQDQKEAGAGGEGSGGSGGTPGLGAADDGGGPNYPRESVVFNGQEYPAVALRPNIPIEPLIVSAIDSARKSVHLALFEFKLAGVLDALRRARERGVAVHVLLDYSNVFPKPEPGSDYKPKRSREIWALLREGFEVKVLRGLGEYGIMHNKLAVIDYDESGKPMLAEYGSYNWSWTAENSHYENANFTVETRRIGFLMAYWQWLDSLARKASYSSKPEDFSWPKTLPPPPVSPPLDIVFNGKAFTSLALSPNRTPGESLEDWLVAAVEASRRTIDLSIFALRSTRIAEALAQAHARGVRVRVVFDQGQAASEPFGPYARWLSGQGIEVRTLSGPDPGSDFSPAQKFHHKFAVFDGELVETGSPNYTKYAAAANFENAHFLKSPSAGTYLFAFEHLFKIAKPLAPPQALPALPADEELLREIEREPGPRPSPDPHPGPAPGVKPREVPFHGIFDSYVLRPDKSIERELVRAIDAAQKSVRIALYEFDLESVMEALRRARRRGLAVEIVVDRSHVYTSGLDSTRRPRMPSPQILALIHEGFDVLVLAGERGGIQHSKHAVLDAELGGLIVFGSYNWAQTAEHNHYESVLFSSERQDVQDLLAYFRYQRSLASPVDKDKLDAVLSRSLADAERESLENLALLEAIMEGQEELDRTSKFPPPPQNPATPIDLHGEKFSRHYFSPQGGIEEAWIRAIKAARLSIEIAMFGFYSRAIAEALLAARKADPKLVIRLVLDSGQGKLAKFDGQPVSEWFAERGFDIKSLAGPNEDGDPMYEKQHNKYLVVDGKFLIAGSFNLSPRAENYNFENIAVTMEPADVAGFAEYFARMYGRGWRPKPRGKGRLLP